MCLKDANGYAHATFIAMPKGFYPTHPTKPTLLTVKWFFRLLLVFEALTCILRVDVAVETGFRAWREISVSSCRNCLARAFRTQREHIPLTSINCTHHNDILQMWFYSLHIDYWLVHKTSCEANSSCESYSRQKTARTYEALCRVWQFLQTTSWIMKRFRG